MRFVHKTRRPMPTPTAVGLKTGATHEAITVHRHDRNWLNELNRAIWHGRTTPGLGYLVNSCTPMKHHRYPPTHVDNDARGLGRQMLDHDPNRTTNIRLLDILRGHLRDVVCRDARRWLVVDSPTSPTRRCSESCRWRGLNRRSPPTTSCASHRQFTPSDCLVISQILPLGWPLSTMLGVRRSLSSVDNIGCLDHRFSNYRFGGIRLEIGEQATSLAPTTLNQPSQKATIFAKHFIFICI